ncbi:hypothetical protein [Maliponia aquimaris]|uniref:Uncharacterized protein n=1 Tax=Maliponia aquimaris TaxID=1673631 RepID=A0A238KAX0_9RHOB|nr:hypothetical protein [Maliponia aquimaris]SMX39096.1 hypothetical protein MAA8898_01878 [Maliponia aquimaris]
MSDGPPEADIRARARWYLRAGHHARGLNETLEERLSRAAGDLHAFTGVRPSPKELRTFNGFPRSTAARGPGARVPVAQTKARLTTTAPQPRPSDTT